ncbi:hypothetical protein L3X38_029027 [Prunus dulcis]|uniref:RNase H type-1 domain-containing protein n=1 Tax=Prunus dulcis TaxID=3755 RepID=A0AAD4VQW8_PRUDU|nr:hypothetical protein L3X38_029027 [Prunus dulcis]
MPGLDRQLVEHKLPIKDGYLPVKHARRRMSMDTELKVKEEIERLLKAGFIRPAIYADWLANIVPVLKRKKGAVRICVDYRNLNEASPKDEYPMPMADMLIDGAAHNQMLSFMDGNAGYNQIMMAEQDIHKTAFMCPGHIGAFEYTVMPFGLRNAGATYQRAINSIFHDMIGHSLEVYIDDVVIKSPEEGNHVSSLRKAFLRMRQHKLKMNPKKKNSTFFFPVKAEARTNIQVGRTAPTGILGNKTLPLKSTSPVPTKKRQTTQALCICIRSIHWKSASSRSQRRKGASSLLSKQNINRSGKKVFRDRKALPGLVFHCCKTQTLHAATHYLHHRQDRLNQIYADKTNAEGQNWEMDFGFDRIHLQASGAGVVLEEPLGVRHCYSFQLDFQCTNNRAEYEALIIGLEMLVELGIQSVEILGDSMLVLKQIAGEYKCLNPSLAVYLVAARNLLTEFREATWGYIPREENFAANELAQVASGIQMPGDCVQRIIKIGRKSLPSVLTRGMEIEVNSALITKDDWREPIMTYLQYPTLPAEKRVRIMATNYLMWNEDLV